MFWSLHYKNGMIALEKVYLPVYCLGWKASDVRRGWLGLVEFAWSRVG